MDLTNIQIAIIVCVYFFGVFSCRFATQFFEVSHAAKLVENTMYRCLLMCSKIHEDVTFITEIKYKHLRNTDFDSQKLLDFRKIDNDIIANWKNSVIQSLVVHSPKTFSFVLNFTSWSEAMAQLEEMHKRQ